MSLFAPLIISLCLLFTASVCNTSAHAATAQDIASALDSPAGIEFSASTTGWSKGTGTVSGISPSGVPSFNSTYLVGTSPAKANPQTQYSFSLKVRGAGTLSFRYQVSLDDWNNAKLCAYDGNYDDGYLWDDSGYWDENVETGWDWWWEEEFALGTDTYTHTVTFAILGPSSEDYEKPVLDASSGEKIYNKAWMDNFVWEPDIFWQILEFFPDPATDNAFEDSVTVSLSSAYDNISFRYTTDGTTPTINSQIYDPWENEGIVITEKTTIKAIAVENNLQINDTVYEATYLLRTKAPEFALSQGDFANSATVNFSSETPGAQFYYTRNGQAPTRLENGAPGENTFKGSKVTLDGNSTIQAMAWAEGLADSTIISKTYEKITPPEITFAPDDTQGNHPYFNDDVTVTLTKDTTIKYQIDEGNILTYGTPLRFDQTTEIRFQAQQAGKLHSDTVTRKFYRADTPFTLDAPAPGWSLFFLPGEVSEQTSDGLIAQLHPIAYDRQKKTYVRTDLLRGGNSYWVFTSAESTRSGISFPIWPLEGISIPSKTWLLSRIPEGATLPQDIQAQTWNGQTFQPVSAPPTGAAWLYNTSDSTIEIKP